MSCGRTCELLFDRNAGGWSRVSAEWWRSQVQFCEERCREQKAEARRAWKLADLTRRAITCTTTASGIWVSGAGASVLREAARRRVTSPPPLQTVCDANSAEMDFLKSAVASAISKGPAFGYTFGDRVDLNDSIWTLHNGTKRVWPECLHVPRQCQLTSVC
jgi:hypothetical protein